jgi:CPA2 family monovalent cation:H+ antiporter-2
MNNQFLFTAIVFLGAALICVPLAKRIGMGSVLGYLIAGAVIGPYLLGFVGDEGEDIMHFAEFGVVMMLFLVGLELEPQKLWKLRKSIIGSGLLQVGFTTAMFIIAGIALGYDWKLSLAVGLALAMSSTAITMQTLTEKGLMQSQSGKQSFAVLLFQDISVIPILALMPLLAVNAIQKTGVDSHSLLHNYPGWLQTVGLLLAVSIIVLVGRFLIVPLLRVVAKTKLRELFTASALLIVFAIAYLMQLVGVSPALGTFLAGVVLANSEFRHELESDIDPFKGLLLGIFFIAVGASVNFGLIQSIPLTIIGITIGVILIKSIVLFIVGRIAGLKRDQQIIFCVSLSQIGEFAFVLFSFMGQLNILANTNLDIFMAATALSMAITPIMFLVAEKWFIGREKIVIGSEKEHDNINEHNQVIIAGFSHYGSTIGRFLRANGIEATILDNDSDRVDLLRKMGFKVYYGDVTRLELLHSVGAANAKLLISAIDSPETTLELIEITQKHFPKLELMIRARNRYHAYELIDKGINYIYREAFDSSVRMGVDALKLMGFRGYSATRAGQNFIKYDEKSLIELSKNRHDQKLYISSVREQIAQQEELLKSDIGQTTANEDHAWDSDHMRETIRKAMG